MSASVSREEFFLDYRGAIVGLLDGGAESLVFATRHPEEKSTGAYRLDLKKGKLERMELERPPTALGRADRNDFFVADDRGQLFRGALSGGRLKPVGSPRGEEVGGIVSINNERVALLLESRVEILAAKDGVPVQKIELPESASALAVSDDGAFLAIGGESGTVRVYKQDQTDYALSSSAKLHDGEVTVLCFEENEPRLLSAGADLRLYITHVRGELEKEDRGGKGNHEKAITAMIQGPRGRFFSAGRDRTVKSWPGGFTKKRAASIDPGDNVRHLSRCTYQGKAHLALACEDRSLRLFPIDDEGRLVEQLVLAGRDAYARAKHEFGRKEAAARESALRELAAMPDGKALKMIAGRGKDDDDSELRSLAATLLGTCGDPRAVAPLEELLKTGPDKVRLAAFAGLREHAGPNSLRPMELAIDSEKKKGGARAGTAAMRALGELAARDDQALTRILKSLGHENPSLRLAALGMLESHYPPGDPTGLIAALAGQHADIRAATLVRFYRGDLLAHPEIPAALARGGEDPDPAVRRQAFLVGLFARPGLARALRARDEDLHRGLWNLEQSAKLEQGEDIGELPAAPAPDGGSLAENELVPLLRGLASRTADSALWAAMGLALLRDDRALGALLQLSRENDEEIRVTVCRGLAGLGDERALSRLWLLLHDPAPRVRDAAFSAIATVHADRPEQVVGAAFDSGDDNVRKRGLALLLERVRSEQAPEGKDDLFARAINDPDLGVAREAFKAVAAEDLMGTTVESLRFLMTSTHATVRRDVFTEVRARLKGETARTLYFDFFEDADADLRLDVFRFALDEYRQNPEPVLARALASPYKNVRMAAALDLGADVERAKSNPDTIRQGLDDDDREIRALLCDLLIRIDAREELEKARNTSKHEDVRLLAASQLALYGDESVLETLMTPLWERAPKKKESHRREAWKANLLLALSGLRRLGSSMAWQGVQDLLRNPDSEIQSAAARALAFMPAPERLDELRRGLAHENEDVRGFLGLALAAHGDGSGAGLLQSAGDERALLAGLYLDGSDSRRPLTLVNSEARPTRDTALALLLLLELVELPARPERLLALLSASDPRLRMTSVRCLEVYPDRQAFEENVLKILGEQPAGQPDWELPLEWARDLGAVLSRGSGPARAHLFFEILASLVELKADERSGRAAFDHRWRILRERFADEIAAARSQLTFVPAGQVDRAGLARLTFGACAGLTRVSESDAAPVRRGAVAHLRELARRDAGLRDETVTTILPGLRDTADVVRAEVFDALLEFKVFPDRIAIESLSSGYADVAGRALDLLAESADDRSSLAVLNKVFLTHEDGLEDRAGEALARISGQFDVIAYGLTARSSRLRAKYLGELAEKIGPDSGANESDRSRAQDLLYGALESRFADTARAAAAHLAALGDGRAFDVLTRILDSVDAGPQREAIRSLARLGDERATSAFLDRIERDPAGTALKKELFAAAGDFRREADVARMLGHVRDKNSRGYVLPALLKISGYDQAFSHPEHPERDEPAFPRRDTVLADILRAVYRAGDARELQSLLRSARPAPAGPVDERIAVLCRYPDDDLRRSALETAAWRLKHRPESKGVLQTVFVELLEHADTSTRFLAADGLAGIGDAAGFQTLLTGVDLFPDYEEREGAVLALGRLGDERALDTILRFVEDEESYQHEAAIEAIGYMSASKESERILNTLTRIARQDEGYSEAALRGLRHFGGRVAWDLIRSFLLHVNSDLRQAAVELLPHDPDNQGGRLLAERSKRETDWRVGRAIVDTLYKIYGQDSPEAIYILLVSNLLDHFRDTPETWKTLREKGDPERLLTLLPDIGSTTYRDNVVSILLERSEIKPDAAARVLNGSHAFARGAVAYMLSRGEGRGVDDILSKALANALERTIEERKESDMSIEKQETLELSGRRIVYACGRLAAGREALLAAANDTLASARLREEALMALGRFRLVGLEIEALESLVQDTHAEIRLTAAGVLAAAAPDRLAKLLPGLLVDRPSMTQATRAGDGTRVLELLRTLAVNPAGQGVALPYLIEREDTRGIQEILEDSATLPAARIGLVEALGQILTVEAREALLAIARSAEGDENEDLRKTAWRALRRASRAGARPTTEEASG